MTQAAWGSGQAHWIFGCLVVQPSSATFCGILSKLMKPWCLYFLICRIGIIAATHHMVGRLNQFKHVKYFKQCLSHHKQLAINISIPRPLTVWVLQPHFLPLPSCFWCMKDPTSYLLPGRHPLDLKSLPSGGHALVPLPQMGYSWWGLLCLCSSDPCIVHFLQFLFSSVCITHMLCVW